jgi:hypothetical protein
VDIVELMHALESAYNHALPGREAVERDAMLRELRRLLEQRAHAPRRRAPLRLRLVRG